MVFTYWKLKFPMSYFNAAVKAYIILGSGISYRPEPGKKYAKIPSWAARPTGLFTFWHVFLTYLLFLSKEPVIPIFVGFGCPAAVPACTGITIIRMKEQERI